MIPSMKYKKQQDEDCPTDSISLEIASFGRKDTFTIKKGVKIISFISWFYVLAASVIISACMSVLIENGEGWMGTLPSFVRTKVISDILISFLFLTISFMQLRYLSRLHLIPVHLLSLCGICFMIVSSIVLAIQFHSSLKAKSCPSQFSYYWPMELQEGFNTLITNYCTESCPCAVPEHLKQIIEEARETKPFFTNQTSTSKCGSVSDQSVQLIQKLEKNWKCSGLCVSSKFFVTIDNFEEIVRNESCFEILIEQSGSLVFRASHLQFIISFVLLIAWTVQLYAINEIKQFANYRGQVKQAMKATKQVFSTMSSSSLNLSQIKHELPDFNSLQVLSSPKS